VKLHFFHYIWFLLLAIGGLPAPAFANAQCPGLYAQLRGRSQSQRLENPLAKLKTQTGRRALLMRAFKDGDLDFSGADLFARSVLELPPEEQAQWRKLIAEEYRNVPKKRTHPQAAWHIGGRRLLDRALMRIERADLLFAAEAAKSSPTEAFVGLLDSRIAAFQSDYTSSEVMQILKQIQLHLRGVQLKQKVSGPEENIIVGGSFLNGKARLNVSDIDLSISNPKMEREISSLASAISNTLHVSHPGAALPIELHGSPESFYGKINTFAVRITADKATLHVFPPGLALGGDSMQTATPAVYPLILPD
jgi:hypothetical protein